MPSLGNFTNVQHHHENATGGGNLGAVQATDLTLTGAAASPPDANTFVKDNIVKGWINFNGTGTISIRDSYNVSAITDNGAGYYTIDWDTNYANANYAVIAIASDDTAVSTTTMLKGTAPTSTTQTTIQVNNDTTGNARDSENVHVISIGDQ